MSLGPKSSAWRAAVGVHTEAELWALGSIGAYRLLALRGYPVSMNMVCAIEGALIVRPWNEISPEERAWLRARADEPWDGRELLEDGSADAQSTPARGSAGDRTLVRMGLDGSLEG